MSVKNYRFVSPGVFVNEIDNSQLPASPAGIGPVIIGRAEKGPGLRPITVNSFEEFVSVFGTPSPGNSGDDVWRQGANTTATTYGMYAAQAYLRNSSPLTYIRLLGAEDDSASGQPAEAGWTAGTNNRAYGLVLFQTGSNNVLTGALGAIFYTKDNVELQLSGAILQGTGTGFTSGTDSAAALTGSDIVVISSDSTAKEFKAVIGNQAAGTSTDQLTFNFNRNDSRYIRKVFNTNPQLLTDAITTTNNRKDYFLGETFDRHLDEVLTDDSSSIAAAFIRIKNGTTQGDDFSYVLQAARTPQIVSCKLSPSATATDLFQFIARGEPGDWTNKNLKVSIQDIKRSTNDEDEYGTFSVVVRHLSDSDNVVRVVEQFNNCNLNPNSLNYIARKIGDYRETWDTTERRYIQEGNYPNNSQYIYVSVNSDVDAGNTNPSLLPFGFKGITKYQDLTAVAGTGAGGSARAESSWVSGSGIALPAAIGAGAYTTGSIFITSGSVTSTNALTLLTTLTFPEPVLRVSASDGNLANPTDAYFGFQAGRSASSTVFAKSTIDLLRPRGGIVGDFTASETDTELSPTFTLDDISGSGVHVVGSGDSGTETSLTAQNGAVSGVLDQGYDRFTVPLFGGFDGVDIKEMDPFSATRMPGTPSDSTSYSFFSIRRAIDSISDPEVVEMNLAAIPAQTQEGLTTHLVRTCEERADALAVIDLPDAFQPREDGSELQRLNTQSTITTLVNGLRSRNLNSSYGAAYYPWVRARDTINGQFVWLPPSVAAIGTFSSSQRRTQVWFAPAGFNRGGLTEGSAGIPVVDVAHQLRRKDRDDLYAANINPIAKFPAEGIVIFGQKTLQVTPSALDRINVRRLMIFVKKRISQIASGLLFDPNVQQTWKRFTAQVNPFLADVKTNFGLSDYRVVLDDTTTTPDLVDRNILYAKIFLKPTRAIEFIAIDFNITRTGASFDD
tara:strand:+ start:2298 stop:5159 length:2862 start_codon:yes stop_codon:yes gene_type:complete